MEFKYPNSKKLYLTVKISQLLNGHNCTYNEADAIIELLQDWIKQSREDAKYDTVADYISNNKTKCVDDEIIKPLNHVEPYC